MIDTAAVSLSWCDLGCAGTWCQRTAWCSATPAATGGWSPQALAEADHVAKFAIGAVTHPCLCSPRHHAGLTLIATLP